MAKKNREAFNDCVRKNHYTLNEIKNIKDSTWPETVIIGGTVGGIVGGGSGIITGLTVGYLALPVLGGWSGHEMAQHFAAAAGSAALWISTTLGAASGIVLNHTPLGKRETKKTEFILDGNKLDLTNKDGANPLLSPENLPRIKISETVRKDTRTVRDAITSVSTPVTSLTGVFVGATVGATLLPVKKALCEIASIVKDKVLDRS